MMRIVTYKDQPINYDIKGEGKTIVLLHGFLESMEIWDDFTEVLSQEYQVVRLDLPGHGKTAVIDRIHSMELMAEVVKTLLDQHHISVCLLVGHSMGGYVALEFARQYPDYVKGIVLFHSHAASDTEEVRENRMRTINMVKLNRKGFIKQFFPDLFAEVNLVRFKDDIERLSKIADRTSVQGITAALYGMMQRSGKLDYLLNSPLPVLFIAGKEDSRIPVQNVLAQAILPRYSEVLVLADVGHMGFIEARDKTLDMIACFARRVFK